MISTKEKILQVAYESFAEQGYAQTSLSQIANQVGIQKGSIFSHFKNKDEIFKEVLDQKVEQYTSHMEYIFTTYKEENVEVLYKKYIEGIIAYIQENTYSTKFWFRKILFPDSALRDIVHIKMEPVNKLLMEHLVYILEKGNQCGVVKEKKSEKLLKYFFHLVYGNLALFLYDDLITRSEIEYICNMFWKSITK